MAARIARIATTIINSISVKPACRLVLECILVCPLAWKNGAMDGSPYASRNDNGRTERRGIRI
jgi:hypothetical protein